MPSIGQENLETIMIDFFGALRRRDFDGEGRIVRIDDYRRRAEALFAAGIATHADWP